METMPNGAGERPELYDVPRDLADESESELAQKDLEAETEETVVVYFTEEDVQDLMRGEEMTWRFTLKNGKEIELLLTTSDDHSDE